MKNLIQEIHRRSLWQVLGIYLAVSWIVLQVIDVLGSNIGLPDWVGPTALALLLVGLPVVIATAFVQEGMSAREFQAPEQSLAEAGEVPPPPAPEPERRHRLFTWKNALIGGGVAFAVLGVLTAGYLALRSAGIGPAGTLVAQGVLDDGASVVLADFQTDDPRLGEVVTGALRIDLLQSPTIEIVEQSEIARALARMQRDAGEVITAEVARELVEREGYGAAIEGEIGPLGSGYVITARVMGGSEWNSLAAFRETARSEDDLIDAIERLSREIRDKAGESLQTVRNGPPLRQVSTGSLEALRLYTQAGSEEFERDFAGATEFYERAVEIDPEFAMAHRKLAVTLGAQAIRRADEIAAATRAFELRDRLPVNERLLAEAYYYNTVGDRPATIRAYERLLEHDPEDGAGLNNLANQLRTVGRFDEAEILAERGLTVSASPQLYRNLAWSRLAQGRAEEAEAAWEAGRIAIPEAAYQLDSDEIESTVSRGEFVHADELIAAFGERHSSPRMIAWNAYHRVLADGVRGRLERASAQLDQIRGAEAYFEHPMYMARHRAALLIASGDSVAAARSLVAAHDSVVESLPAADRLYDWWLPLLVEAGAIEDARRLNAEWESEVPANELADVGRDARRELAARLAFHAGDLTGSVRLWEAYERECPGDCAIVSSVHIARVLDAGGNTAGAIDQYERYLRLEYPTYRADYDLMHRAPTLERLAQLYEQVDDELAAARYYAAFVELWADADAVLQPRVETARTRLAALRGAGE
jgi:tetratricopeptide (TPR) repeat protein